MRALYHFIVDGSIGDFVLALILGAIVLAFLKAILED
jgi:hypothetical protein